MSKQWVIELKENLDFDFIIYIVPEMKNGKTIEYMEFKRMDDIMFMDGKQKLFMNAHEAEIYKNELIAQLEEYRK